MTPNQLTEKLGWENTGGCYAKYRQPHRFYHNLNHITEILEASEKLYGNGPTRNMIDLIALYHDVIYNPKKNDNEECSIEYFWKHCSLRLSALEKEQVVTTIRHTKYNNYEEYKNLPSDDITKLFCELDLQYLKSTDPVTIRNNELNMFKEYQFVDFITYRSKRLEFLKTFKYCEVSPQITYFLNNYRPRIGIYAGSFNPFHIGHMNIVEQAEKLFDKVIIAVGVNPDKMLSDNNVGVMNTLPFHQIAYYNGLLSDYVNGLIGYADVTLIRGLRNSYDLLYEENQLRILRDCGCNVPVIYLLCSKDTSHISSSMIRGLERFPNSHIEKYIPDKYAYEA